MDENRITLLQILRSDRPAYYTLILAFIFWVLYLITVILGLFGLVLARRNAVLTSENVFLLAIIISPPFFLFSVLRIIFLLRLHKSSIEKIAEVVNKERDGQGGFIYYQYECNGERYSKKIIAFGIAKFNVYTIGEKALFLVNERNPEKAIFQKRI